MSPAGGSSSNRSSLALGWSPRRTALAAALLFLVLLPALAPIAPPASRAEEEPKKHDATSHHSFEEVEKWVGVFDDPARDAWQKPGEVVRFLGLKPEQAAADLGAGTGYFLGHLSAAVGPKGTIWALDTEPRMIEHIRQRVEKAGWSNVRPLLCPPDSPGVSDRSLDRVLVVDTWHHIDDRLGYLPRLEKALAPGGRVAVVDFRKDLPPPPGPPQGHRLDRAVVVSEFEQAGWSLVEEPKVLEYQYFLIFQPDPRR